MFIQDVAWDINPHAIIENRAVLADVLKAFNHRGGAGALV